MMVWLNFLQLLCLIKIMSTMVIRVAEQTLINY